MKFFLLLAFVAFSQAVPLVGTGNFQLTDDGWIITSPYGYQATYSKPKGQKQIEIVVSGPHVPTKTIEINEKYGTQQFDVLRQVLQQFQGTVDENVYQQFLDKVYQCVQKGQISQQVYQILQDLCRQEYQFYEYPEQYYQYDVRHGGRQVQRPGYVYGQGIYGEYDPLRKIINLLFYLGRQSFLQQQRQQEYQQQYPQYYQQYSRQYYPGQYDVPVGQGVGVQREVGYGYPYVGQRQPLEYTGTYQGYGYPYNQQVVGQYQYPGQYYGRVPYPYVQQYGPYQNTPYVY